MAVTGRTSWTQPDFYAAPGARPSPGRGFRQFSTFTVVPSEVPPRRYGGRWQLAQWLAAAILLTLLIVT